MHCALAVLIALCAGLDDWSKATAALRRALSGGSSEKEIEQAVVAVARDNSERAVKLLVASLATDDAKAYWIVIAGLGQIGSKEAVEELVRQVLTVKPPSLRRDLMAAVQANGSAFIDDGLARILDEGTPDLQLVAIDDMLRRGKKESIPRFLEVVKKHDSAENEVKRQALKALRAMTGLELTKASDWTAWWDKNKETFKVGGEPATPAAGGAGAGTTVAESLKRNRTTDYEDLKKGAKHDIVAVSGVFDTVQDVLDKMKIPRTLVDKDGFEKQDLSKTSALLINCDEFEGAKRLSNASIAKIRDFVARGGYLFTSDWGLVDVIERAFPGTCKNGGVPTLEKVRIYPAKGATGHPFLREVFVKHGVEGGTGGKSGSLSERKLDFEWVIDGGSFAIDYDPAKVTVLVESPELKDHIKHGAVAVTFVWGDSGERVRESVATGGVYEELPKMRGGKVLHVLSHFGKQRTKDDEYAIQGMLLNFLIEAKDRKLMRAAPKKK
jgi:hypothetical protein